MFVSQYSSWLEKGFVKILVQEDHEGDLDLNKQGVPLVVHFAKTADAKEVLNLVYSQGYFGRPYVVAPGVPTERVEALRKAFMQAAESNELLIEAKRINLGFSPNSGKELQEIIAKMYSAPPEIINKAKQALSHAK